MANGHGGYRDGAGRKARAEETKLIEKLSPLEDIAFEKLKAGVEAGDFQYIKMFMEYRFGRPKQTIDASVDATIEQITGMVIK